MQARELIEVAATLCLDARQLLEDSPRLCDQALAEYWAASRCRLDEWGRQLSRLANHTRAAADPRDDLAALAEDVLLSQVHTRCLAAITVAHDRCHGRDDAGPIGRNTLAGHDEALGRLRALADAWWRTGSRPAARLRRLANRSERWTDMLLAYVLPLCGSPGVRSPSGHPVEFTFDPARAQEFAYDAQAHEGPAGQSIGATSQVLHAAIRESFATARADSPCGGFNRRIAGASIGLFGAEAFDGHGLLRTAWIARIERTADDTVGMVEDLFRDEHAGPFRAPARWRM